MSLNFKLDLKIDEESSKRIIDWTLTNYKNLDYFVNTGQGRRYCTVNKFDTEITELVNKIAVEKYTELGIIGCFVEPIYGHYIDINSEGGSLNLYKEENTRNLVHTRVNFMLSLPENGGQQIIEIDGEKHNLQIGEGESWINLAGLWKSGTNKVEGQKPRIMLSLGSLVSLNTLQLFFPEFFPDLKWETRPETNKMITIGQ